VETVEIMHRICVNAEASIFYGYYFNEIRLVSPSPDIAESLAVAAVSATLSSDIGAIFVLTTSGTTARVKILHSFLS